MKEERKRLTPQLARRLGKNPKCHLVVIDHGDPVPLKIVVNTGDWVCWYNGDSNDWIASFPESPFANPPADPAPPELIVVPAVGPPQCRKITADPGPGHMKNHKYGLKLNAGDPDPPPDGPGVIVDGG